MQAYWPLYPMNNLMDIKSIITHSLKIQLGLAIKILRNKRNESATSYGPVCLSVSVCHKSEFYQNIWHRKLSVLPYMLIKRFRRLACNASSFPMPFANAALVFFTAQRYACALLAMAPCVWSVSVCQKSEFYRNNVTHTAVFGTRASFDLPYKEIRVSSKIKALPSGTLENFATAKSMVY